MSTTASCEPRNALWHGGREVRRVAAVGIFSTAGLYGLLRAYDQKGAGCGYSGPARWQLICGLSDPRTAEFEEHELCGSMFLPVLVARRATSVSSPAGAGRNLRTRKPDKTIPALCASTLQKQILLPRLRDQDDILEGPVHESIDRAVLLLAKLRAG